jgi:hypothetical protein
MVLGPLIALAATIPDPPHAAENGTEYYQAAHDHSNQFYVAHTLFFLGAVFLLPAVIGLTRLLRAAIPRRPSGSSCSRPWGSCRSPSSSIRRC